MADEGFLTVPRFAGLISIGLAGVCGFFGVFLPARVATGSAGWTATPCTILFSEVAEEEKTEPWGNNTRTFKVYSPAITFAYEVDGTRHTSSTVSLKAGASRDDSWAREMVDKFPVDTDQTCYVDPDNPDAAILEPLTRGYEQYVFAAGTLVLLATGLFLLIRG